MGGRVFPFRQHKCDTRRVRFRLYRLSPPLCLNQEGYWYQPTSVDPTPTLDQNQWFVSFGKTSERSVKLGSSCSLSLVHSTDLSGTTGPRRRRRNKKGGTGLGSFSGEVSGDYSDLYNSRNVRDLVSQTRLSSVAGPGTD